MIDRASAKAMALKYLEENYGQEPEVAIVDGEPSETICAWIFFYNSKRFLETGEISEALAGNGPILVNKRTGEIEAFGTAMPLNELFAEYDRKQGS